MVVSCAVVAAAAAAARGGMVSSAKAAVRDFLMYEHMLKRAE